MQEQQTDSLIVFEPGSELEVVRLECGQNCRRKLRGMGLHSGVRFTVVKNNTEKAEGPMLIRLGDTKLMLGHGLAGKIIAKRAE